MIEESDYEWETEHRDVAEVMQRLGLDAEPVDVEMVGRNIAFKYPASTEGGSE